MLLFLVAPFIMTGIENNSLHEIDELNTNEIKDKPNTRISTIRTIYHKRYLISYCILSIFLHVLYFVLAIVTKKNSVTISLYKFQFLVIGLCFFYLFLLSLLLYYFYFLFTNYLFDALGLCCIITVVISDIFLIRLFMTIMFIMHSIDYCTLMFGYFQFNKETIENSIKLFLSKSHYILSAAVLFILAFYADILFFINASLVIDIHPMFFLILSLIAFSYLLFTSFIIFYTLEAFTASILTFSLIDEHNNSFFTIYESTINTICTLGVIIKLICIKPINILGRLLINYKNPEKNLFHLINVEIYDFTSPRMRRIGEGLLIRLGSYVNFLNKFSLISSTINCNPLEKDTKSSYEYHTKIQKHFEGILFYSRIYNAFSLSFSYIIFAFAITFSSFYKKNDNFYFKLFNTDFFSSEYYYSKMMFGCCISYFIGILLSKVLKTASLILFYFYLKEADTLKQNYPKLHNILEKYKLE